MNTATKLLIERIPQMTDEMLKYFFTRATIKRNRSTPYMADDNIYQLLACLGYEMDRRREMEQKPNGTI